MQLRILYRSRLANKNVSTFDSSFTIHTSPVDVVDSKSTNEDFDSLIRIDILNEELNVETFLLAQLIC